MSQPAMADARFFMLPRFYISGVDSDPDDSNEQEYYSARGPGSPKLEGMGWVQHPKPSYRQKMKDKTSLVSDIKKHHAPKTPSPPLISGPRNQNPGIDAALRNLCHEVTASIRTFQYIVDSFEEDTEALQGWAERETLDVIWRNKVKDMCSRNKVDRQWIEGTAQRITTVKAFIKEAVRQAKVLKATWDNRYEIERQIRTAKKMLPYCDGIINLAGRAANEAQACEELVIELEEVQWMLGRWKNSWICECPNIGKEIRRLDSFGMLNLACTDGTAREDSEHSGSKKRHGTQKRYRRESESTQKTEESENPDGEEEQEQEPPCESAKEEPQSPGWERSETGKDW
jgi:hypothetical protein